VPPPPKEVTSYRRPTPNHGRTRAGATIRRPPDSFPRAPEHTDTPVFRLHDGIDVRRSAASRSCRSATRRRRSRGPAHPGLQAVKPLASDRLRSMRRRCRCPGRWASQVTEEGPRPLVWRARSCSSWSGCGRPHARLKVRLGPVDGPDRCRGRRCEGRPGLARREDAAGGGAPAKFKSTFLLEEANLYRRPVVRAFVLVLLRGATPLIRYDCRRRIMASSDCRGYGRATGFL